MKNFIEAVLFKRHLTILGYNTFTILMHTHQKQNFLRVCFDPSRGLRLNWSFKDLSSNQRYFRHVFAICTQNWKQTLILLESLYKKMKSGDLFCFIYPHDATAYKISRWVEKSQLNSFNAQRYFKETLKRRLDASSKGKIIDAAGKQANQFDQPVVINFLGVSQNQVNFYRNEIMRHRFSLKPAFQYIVNLFGDFEQNTISVHSGFNLFSTKVPNFIEHADYYHKMINGAAVQSAHIDIIAGKGELSLFNETYWKNTDFNRISADYYGPSASFDTQNIYFFNKDSSVDYEHEFQVKLRIKLFQNKVLQSQKRIKINFLQNKDYCPTYGNYRNTIYLHQKNILLSQNPDRCQLIVKFKANRDQADADF